MAQCAHCGEEQAHPYTCNYCDFSYCTSHRLPENHNCPGLSATTSDTERLSSDGPTTLGQTSNLTERKGNDTPLDRKGEKDSTADTSEADEERDWPKQPESSSPPVRVKQSSSSQSSRDQADPDGEEGSRGLLGGVSDILATILFIPIQALSRVYGFSKKFVRTPFRFIFSAKFLIGFIAAIVLISATVGTGIPIIDQTVDNPLETGSEAVDNAGDAAADATTVNRTELRLAIHQEVNSVRNENGLSELSYTTELQEVAAYHSQDMLNESYFAHDSPTGETLRNRYQRYNIGCGSSGENIYRSTSSAANEQEFAEEVVNAWMNSPGHRENILKSDWQSEGIGITIGQYEGDKTVFVTQNFC